MTQQDYDMTTSGHVTASDEADRARYPRSSRSSHSAALGCGRSSGWSKAVLLVICLLLAYA
jgi:hypothetical protein